MPTDEPPPIIFVRVKRGLIGNTKRVVHIVPMSPEDQSPTELVAYCRERFTPGTIDLLDGPTGMPCMTCLALSSAEPRTALLESKNSQDQ